MASIFVKATIMSGENQDGLKTLAKEILVLAIIVGIVYLGFTYGLKIVFRTDTPIMVVVSGSMVPTINVDDLIIVQGVDPSTLQVGDIIVFKNPKFSNTASCETGQCIVHRIISIVSRDPPMFRTKGDANLAPDPFVVSGSDVVGKVILIIPKLGILTRILKPPYNYLTILLILIGFILYEAKTIFGEEEEDEFDEDYWE